MEKLDDQTWTLALVLAFAVFLLFEQVLKLRRRVTQLERGTRPSLPATAAELPAELQERVWGLVRSGKKIEAIRVVRAGTGLGLKEAKQLVDRL